MREVKYKNSLVASAFYTQKGAFVSTLYILSGWGCNYNMEDEECAGYAEEVRRYFADMELLFVKNEFRLYGGIMEVIMGSWMPWLVWKRQFRLLYGLWILAQDLAGSNL